MNKPFLFFNRPDIGEEEIAEVVSSLRSGWLTTGPKTKQFESDFSAFLGGGVETIAINSSTAGLHLGLEAMGIKPGDEVITTTHTFTATAEIVRYLGAKPVFVDVDRDTLCIDIDAIEKAITPSTKAIIPVHFAGLSCDMRRLLTLAKQNKLKVLEDAAHALPTTIESKLIGTLASDATVFSFYANKTITTGEGGMLVTRNPEIAKRARVMRLHGIDRDIFNRFNSKKPSWHYEVIAPGYKYNMTDIAAAIGIHQLKKIYQFQSRRQAIAEMYNKAFLDLPIILPPRPAAGDIHSWHLYVIQLQNKYRGYRDQFIQKMHELGVGCSLHYIPLHLHPYWRDTYNLRKETFPNSQRIYETCVSLPIYSKMTDADIEQVISSVKKFFQ